MKPILLLSFFFLLLVPYRTIAQQITITLDTPAIQTSFGGSPIDVRFDLRNAGAIFPDLRHVRQPGVKSGLVYLMTNGDSLVQEFPKVYGSDYNCFGYVWKDPFPISAFYWIDLLPFIIDNPSFRELVKSNAVPISMYVFAKDTISKEYHKSETIETVIPKMGPSDQILIDKLVLHAKEKPQLRYLFNDPTNISAGRNEAMEIFAQDLISGSYPESDLLEVVKSFIPLVYSSQFTSTYTIEVEFAKQCCFELNKSKLKFIQERHIEMLSPFCCFPFDVGCPDED